MPTRRDICHHFVDFGDIFCGSLSTFRCLFFVFWRPRHLAWTLLTQFGAFFIRLGAQGHNVMKPVSQGTFNVRFERIQGSPLGPFWMHFCSFFRFCDFAETVLPCRRQYLFASLGGARPSLLTPGPPVKNNSAKKVCEGDPLPPVSSMVRPLAPTIKTFLLELDCQRSRPTP